MSTATKDVRNDRRHWSWGKEIPIAPLLALVLQTVAGVAWLSDLNSSVKTTRAEVMEVKAEVKVLASKVETPTMLNSQAISDMKADIAALRAQVQQHHQELARYSVIVERRR